MYHGLLFVQHKSLWIKPQGATFQINAVDVYTFCDIVYFSDSSNCWLLSGGLAFYSHNPSKVRDNFTFSLYSLFSSFLHCLLRKKRKETKNWVVFLPQKSAKTWGKDLKAGHNLVTWERPEVQQPRAQVFASNLN